MAALYTIMLIEDFVIFFSDTPPGVHYI